MKRREDGAVREVMKELLRSDLRFHKTDCGRFGAMTAWGLKDTSSRPAKDLGGTLRHTIRTMLRSYDSRASGDLLCSHRQGAWQMWRKLRNINRKRLPLSVQNQIPCAGSFGCQRIHVILNKHDRDFAFKIKSSPFCKGSIWQNGEFSYWIKSYCFFCISNQKGHLLLYNYVTHKTTRKKVSLMKN